jgi:hypothetical protein
MGVAAEKQLSCVKPRSRNDRGNVYAAFAFLNLDVSVSVGACELGSSVNLKQAYLGPSGNL